MGDEEYSERDGYTRNGCRMNQWGDVIYSHGYLDLYGKPVKRTRDEYPYSYDPYVTWKSREVDLKEITGTVYSDRLLQWGYNKTRTLMKKHFGTQGDYYSGREPKKIESFLAEYMGHDITLIAVQEGCNVSNGYPYWVFHYRVDKYKMELCDKYETTIGKLAEEYDHLMLGDERFDTLIDAEVFNPNGNAIGFTIGNGKQMHWFIEPSARTGKYRCYQAYDNGETGRGRYLYPEHKVTVHYDN